MSTTAGKMLTVVESVNPFILVQMATNKMACFAIHTVEMDTMELDQFVGKIAQMDLKTLELIASSLIHMEEGLDIPLNQNAIITAQLVVKSMVYSGTQNAAMTTMHLDAVSALHNAQMECLILEFLAKRNLMEELLVFL